MTTVSNIAWRKIFLHSCKNHEEDVFGLLVGQLEGSKISIQDVYPISHSRVTASTLQIAFEIVSNLIQGTGKKIVGHYFNPVGEEEYEAIFNEKVANLIKTNSGIATPYKIKVKFGVEGDASEEEGQQKQMISKITAKDYEKTPTTLLNGWFYKGNAFESDKTYQIDEGMIEQDFKDKLNYQIADLDNHLEDINLDIRNSFIC